MRLYRLSSGGLSFGRRGDQVTVIDNCSVGNLRNLAHQMENTDLRIYEADVNDRKLMEKVIDKDTLVFHLAALADIVPSVQDPEKYFHANVDGTFSVLEACRSNGVKKLTYVASSSCYGLPLFSQRPKMPQLNRCTLMR